MAVTYDDLIRKGLDTRAWLRAWRTVIDAALAETAQKMIDFNAPLVAEQWDYLDTPAVLITNPQRLVPALVDSLLLHRKDLNGAFLKRGLHEQSPKWFRNQLTRHALVFVQRTQALDELDRRPFPRLASVVAARLVTHIHRERADIVAGHEPEWRLLNRLLIASYLFGTKIPLARIIRQDLNTMSKGPLPLRGSLVRILEKADEPGSSDLPPAKAGTPKPLRLAHYGVSQLARAFQDEWISVAKGAGLMHRLGESARPVSPEHRGRVTHSQVQQGRHAMYLLYEYSILSYLGLSACEQLLRSWAQKSGVVHLKSNGEPTPVAEWLKHLPIADPVRTQLADIYSPSRGNIRNRLVHGGLLEIESKRQEQMLPIADPRRFQSPQGIDRWSAENVAHLVRAALGALDKEIAQRNGGPLSRADFNWMTNVALSAAEIELGQTIHCDFLESQDSGEEWLAQLSVFTRLFLPAVSVPFKIGFHGWVRRESPSDSLIQFMYLTFTFEPLYRLVVHLMREQILQVSLERGSNHLKMQYRMLEDRGKGLCTAPILNRILREVDPEYRGNAHTVLLLAVKARNALAHGAISGVTGNLFDGIGHLLVKSVQTLYTAAFHHLASDAAYFRYLKDPNTGELENWLAGERAMFRQIAQADAEAGALPKRR